MESLVSISFVTNWFLKEQLQELVLKETRVNISGKSRIVLNGFQTIYDNLYEL